MAAGFGVDEVERAGLHADDSASTVGVDAVLTIQCGNSAQKHSMQTMLMMTRIFEFLSADLRLRYGHHMLAYLVAVVATHRGITSLQSSMKRMTHMCIHACMYLPDHRTTGGTRN